MSGRTPHLGRALGVLCALALASGCDKKESSSETSSADAGAAETGPQLDPALAQAMASATAKGAAPQKAAATDGGPPPQGIFLPGAADKEVKKNDPPKLTLGESGAPPKVSLGTSGFTATSKFKASVEVAIQSDPRGALPIQFAVAFSAKPPDQATTLPAGAMHVTAKVENAQIGGQGGVPPEAAQAVAKLKGSSVQFTMLPDGGAAALTATSPAGNGAQQDQALLGLRDALASLALPRPSEPVGAGAFWMVTTRDEFIGLDVVSYHLVRVQRIDANTAVLGVETKRYAASDDFKLSGLVGEFTLSEINSTSQGTLMLGVGQPLPFKGMLQGNLAALVAPTDKPEQQGRVQLSTQARFDIPGAAPQGAAAPAGNTPPQTQ